MHMLELAGRSTQRDVRRAERAAIQRAHGQQCGADFQSAITQTSQTGVTLDVTPAKQHDPQQNNKRPRTDRGSDPFKTAPD